MTEKQFQDQVLELARLCKWLCYHPYDSRRSQPGFPDLCMVRGDRIVFAELKVNGRKPTAAQRTWLDALGETAAEVHVWTPEDWEEIEATLTRRAA